MTTKSLSCFPRFALGFFSCVVLVACWSQTHNPAAATALPPVSSTIQTPLVNLPDFTRLVEQAGPAVVNIEAKLGGNKEQAANLAPDQVGPGADDDQMQEFFRRFFGHPGGPGMPMPKGPRGGTSFGTGFIISADGYVLTNRHVIEDASEVIVHLSDRRQLTAKVIGSDPSSDVALLKVTASNLPVLTLGNSHSLKPGQWVLAIGSPFGFDHSVTAGVVSGLGRPSIDGSQRYVPFIQTDVAINRGNSGGPLMNTRGEVVGINSQIFSNSGGYMGVSFAIPIEVAMNAVQQLKISGKVSRGQLGVQIKEVDSEDIAELGLSRTAGAFVGGVQNGSTAEKAGIRPGDVITAFNGREIGSASELPPLVGALPPGSSVKVSLLRNGKPLEITVVLSKLQESVADSAVPQTPSTSTANGLGLTVTEIDMATRSKLGLAMNEGVRISRVDSQIARMAGLAPGDVILQIGKTPVGSVAQFEAATQGLKSGERARLLTRNSESTGLITLTIP